MMKPRGGMDLAKLAERFDLAENTLKQFLQNKKRPRPHFNTLSGIAALVGCDVMEFVGEASAPQPEDQAALAFGNIMGVLGKNLTPEMRAAMIEMAKTAQLRGAELEAQAQKAKK